MTPMPELASVLARDRWLVMKAAVSERCRILVAVRWSARWNGSAPPSPTCRQEGLRLRHVKACHQLQDAQDDDMVPHEYQAFPDSQRSRFLVSGSIH